MNTSIKLGLMPSSFSLPFRGRAGVGASGASIARSARPHPDLPPKGEGATP
jgi:hypothetical protein